MIGMLTRRVTRDFSYSNYCATIKRSHVYSEHVFVQRVGLPRLVQAENAARYNDERPHETSCLLKLSQVSTDSELVFV
jgi:hypothetical protein